MQRGQDDGDAQPHLRGALADGGQGDVGGAGVGPFGPEVMLDEPDAGHADFLGVGDFFQHFVITLGLALVGPGFGHLNLVEQTKLHGDGLLGKGRRRVGGIVADINRKAGRGLPGRTNVVARRRLC